MDPIENIIGQLDAYIFAKDLSHRYIFCNEKFAHASGEDSPTACYGKTDANVIWRKYAGIYTLSDEKALRGQALCNILEPQSQFNRDGIVILVNKHPLLNQTGNIIGVVGSYVDVTDLNIVTQNSIRTIPNTACFDLGEYFDHTTLTRREFQVLKKVLLGQTAKQIAAGLCISQKTVETYMARIKVKMQCTSCGEIIYQAVISGLYHRLLNELLCP